MWHLETAVVLVCVAAMDASSQGRPSDLVACVGEVLNLTCPDDAVVSSEVYVGINSQTTRTQCNSYPGDCLSNPLQLAAEINTCNWQKSSCEIEVTSLFPTVCPPGGSPQHGDYLIAKNFACIPASELYNICDEHDLGREGYVTTPLYPQPYVPDITCSQVIALEPMKELRMRIVSADLPGNDGECNKDFLEISSPLGATRFCGHVNYATPEVNWSYSAPHGGHVELKFVSTVANHHQGFALHIEQTELNWTGNTIDPLTDVITATQPSLNRAVLWEGLDILVIVFAVVAHIWT